MRCDENESFYRNVPSTLQFSRYLKVVPVNCNDHYAGFGATTVDLFSHSHFVLSLALSIRIRIRMQ